MKIFFYGNVLEFTNNEKLHEISGDAKNCPNVRSLINILGTQYGERFRNFLLGEETCFFLVNGKGLMLTGGLDTQLNMKDKIEILPIAEAG